MADSNTRLMIGADEIRDWLLETAAHADDMSKAVAELCERILVAGVPIARFALAAQLLHASMSGIAREWRVGEPVFERLFPFGTTNDRSYERSPYYEAHRTGKWVMFNPQNTPDDAFGVVPDLKAGGYTHYVCVPMTFGSGRNRNGVTFATRAPGGFEEEHMRFFRRIVPALRIVMELRSSERNLSAVLQTYVGGDPHKRILAGDVHRGKVTRIKSAIFFIDLRNFTALSMALAEEDITDLLNRYFDCVVPEVERVGGEVLKFIGDGVLAIFQERDGDSQTACRNALEAAVASLQRIERANSYGSLPATLAAGVALHHGEAAYGNVGSGDRLDFTVIGRDVNIASRIARLNVALKSSILMSESFATELIDQPMPLGLHELKGIPGQHALFAVRP